MLISESLTNTKEKKPTITAGIPQLHESKDSKTKIYLMLTGRILLPLMFISLLRWDTNEPLRMVF